jgi:hypothetical protein
MNLQDVIALQPSWLQYWLIWLTMGSLALPVVLLFWRKTRIAGLAAIVTGVAGEFGIFWLFDRLGYVKLLGLPHIIMWTPLAIYLGLLLRRADIPKWPRWITMIVLATLVISLAFDYADTLRYLMGERTPFTKPA